ncbi:IS982 family transposase [Spirosoma pomorum]
MADKTIAIYCFFDDLFKAMARHTDVHCKVNDAQIATTALIAALKFYGNHAAACDYMHQHHQMASIDKSTFNRRLHRLEFALLTIFQALGLSLKELNTSARYIIDSFPVAICRNCRIPVCKLLTNKAYRGYNEAKKEYFYGFKVQLLITTDGLPVDYYVTAGSFHDATALQAMHLDLPAGSIVYGDSGYTDYEQEDLYAECEQITLSVHRRKNSRRPDEAWQRYLKKLTRKSIKTVISTIENRFPRKIHAVTVQGFLLKVFLFILADTVNKCLV